MTFTSISAVILTVMALIVFGFSRKAYKSGLSKSLVDLSVIIFSMFFGALAAIWVSGPLTNVTEGILSGFGFYEEIGGMLEGFEGVILIVIRMLLTILLYVPLFFVVRFIVKLLVSFMLKGLSQGKKRGELDYQKENEDYYVTKNKSLAAFVGALSGFLVTIVIFTPLAGTARTAASALEFANSVMGEETLGEEVDEVIGYIDGDFSIALIHGCGGRMLFDFSTKVSVDGEITDLGSELEALKNIDLNEFAKLVSFEGGSVETAERIKSLTADIEKSKIMKLAFVETVQGLSSAWLNGESYMGAARPYFDSYNAINSFIDEVLYVCSTSTTKTITKDINTLVNISSMLVEEQTFLESGDYSQIIETFTAENSYNIIKRIKDELEKNDHMRPVLYAVDDLIVSIVLEEVQDYDKYLPEDCEDLFVEISDILTATSTLSEQARISAVSNNIKEQLGQYGVYVPETLNESIASTLIDALGTYGTSVTFEDVKSYFEGFIDDGSSIEDYFPLQ